jgi:hypothetical protein
MILMILVHCLIEDSKDTEETEDNIRKKYPKMSSQDLLVVMMGAASTITQKGFLPSLEELMNTKSKKNFRLIIIDPNLKYVRAAQARNSTPTDVLGYVVDDFKLIEKYPRWVEISDDHYHSIPDIIRFHTGTVVYVSYLGKNSSYEIMSLLNTYIFSKRTYINSTQRVNLLEILSKPLLEPYNLYSGEIVPRITDEDKRDCYKQLLSGCFMASSFLMAGYDTQKNLCDVESWCLNPETPFTKGCVHVYKLFSPVDDAIPIQQMITNSGYRMQIFNTIARVISNFAIKNNIITPGQAKETGGWFSPRTYELISNSLLRNPF